MTSKQVMLMLWTLALLTGCVRGRSTAPPLVAPYEHRQLWAVAPLRNESGSLQADGVRFADQLARQLENAQGLDVLPVSRVLQAMDGLQLASVTTKVDALTLLKTLGVDALLVGTITDYDPYDPPKLGLAVELYLDPRATNGQPRLDPRELTRSPTDPYNLPSQPQRTDQPVSVVSAFFDAADPAVRERLERYARDRGPEQERQRGWRLYRISIDLYSEFVSYLVSSRLLDVETQRLTPPPPTEKPAS